MFLVTFGLGGTKAEFILLGFEPASSPAPTTGHNGFIRRLRIRYRQFGRRVW